MKILLSFLIALLGIVLFFAFVLPAFIRHNQKEKEAERRWTDPKFRD